jgi:hypothetical protein
MLLGQEIYHSQNKKNFQKNRYFPRAFEAGQAWDNMGFGTPQESTSSLSTPDRTASFFGQASYNYNHKYLLSVTIRAWIFLLILLVQQEYFFQKGTFR